MNQKWVKIPFFHFVLPVLATAYSTIRVWNHCRKEMTKKIDEEELTKQTEKHRSHLFRALSLKKKKQPQKVVALPTFLCEYTMKLRSCITFIPFEIKKQRKKWERKRVHLPWQLQFGRLIYSYLNHLNMKWCSVAHHHRALHWTKVLRLSIVCTLLLLWIFFDFVIFSIANHLNPMWVLCTVVFRNYWQQEKKCFS